MPLKKVHFLISILFLTLPLIFSLVSCQSDIAYHEVVSIKENWKNQKCVFTYQSKDTARAKDLMIFLRAGHSYPYSNIYLISKIHQPNGETLVDTLHYEMATPSGEMLGQGFSDVKESLLNYKLNHTFKDTGAYIFEIKHAMRVFEKEKTEANLPGIYSVGLLMKNTEKN